MAPPRVILLPGAVLPAAAAYSGLIEALDARAEVLAKDLELYAGDAISPSYRLDDEITGIIAAADERGWDRLHLAGYSGGGAAALACTAREPDRVLSLALFEPAWAGRWDMSAAEQAARRAYEALADTPPERFLSTFAPLNLAPGVQPPPPPPGEPPPWMALRPAGIATLTREFATYELDREALARFDRPVYYALGGLSNPDQYGEIAKRLATVFPNFTLETFEDRHHFDPPHRVESERLAASLEALWAQAA